MTKKLLSLLILLTPVSFCQNISYSYDAAGRLAVVDYGNGTQIVYSYDNAGNLLSRNVTSASSTQKPQPSVGRDSLSKAPVTGATDRKKKPATRRR